MKTAKAPQPENTAPARDNVWAVSSAEALQRLETDGERGLSKEEAVKRLGNYGPNVLYQEKGVSTLERLLSQFKSPVVLVLIAAMVLAALLGEFVDAVVIALIVLLNAAVGYFQEAKAERSVQALKRLSAPHCRVLRSGEVQDVTAEAVVPGDILMLEAGDLLAADGRILEAHQLLANEAPLTGESLPVSKSVPAVASSALLAERSSMVFGGTTVASGSGKAVVAATGMRTEIGRIAELLQQTKPGPTPLQEKLEKVSSRLIVFCGVVIALVFGLGIYRGDPFLEVLLTAVSLAVAAIPEGLPAVVTLALALAIRRMAGRNAVVRQLAAVETLGSTDIICTDKTGTITSGEMRVREVWVDGRWLEVEKDNLSQDGQAMELIRAASLCTNATINADGSATGDPTEVALLRLAIDAGEEPAELKLNSRRLSEWAFDSDRKRMSVAVESEFGEPLLLVKGAPESILPRSANAKVSEVEAVVDRLSSLGRRTLAIARRSAPDLSNEGNMSENHSLSDKRSLSEKHSADAVESNLEFLGIVSLADPPRAGAAEAVQACQDAGIFVSMITGDHPATARAIAEEVGIFQSERGDEVLSGAHLSELSDEELARRVERVSVYARVSPEDKLRIIRAWKSRDKVVAMTGDGVNDAPALKEASIGVSMGKGGTEVARQASSMILADDNFSTIVSAVEEGRAVHGNIRRTTRYLLAGNMAEILVVLIAALFAWPMPLFAIHLLWINLVTDGVPTLALAAERVPKNFLRESGRPSPATFMDPDFFKNILFTGTLTAGLTLTVYGFSLQTGDATYARTNAFSVLVFAELFRSFADRSDRDTVFELGIFTNPYHVAAVVLPIGFQLYLHHTTVLADVFKVEPVSMTQCVIGMAVALLPVSILEARKLRRRKRSVSYRTRQGAL